MIARPTKILLEELHILYADDVAVNRMNFAKDNYYKPKNGGEWSGEITLWKDRLGARCEAAGKLYFNPVSWNLYIHHLPDFDNFIDVKGVQHKHHCMIVQKDDPPHWAYVLVDASEHPIYDVVGWCWGWEAKQTGLTDPSRENRPAHFISRENQIMKPPHTLWELLRGLQKARLDWEGDTLPPQQA